MKLYFVRHGQTDANGSSKSVSELDEPLNDVGIDQAKELADQLKDVKFDKIISSPYKRSTQTAEIINEYHKLPTEIDGIWSEIRTGRYLDPTTWNELFDFDKNIQIENGESLDDFFNRVDMAIENLKNDHPDKTLLLVSHGGVQHVLYANVNKLPRKGNMRISPMRTCELRIYDL